MELKPKNLIAISSLNEEESYQLAEEIALFLKNKGCHFVTHSLKSLAYNLTKIACNTNDPLSQAWLTGDEWSYIREERFITRQGVEIKPVKYHLSPKMVSKKIYHLMKTIHSNFWINFVINLAIDSLKSFDVEYKGIIITDINYPGEFTYLKDRGAYMIYHFCKPDLNSITKNNLYENYKTQFSYMITTGSDAEKEAMFNSILKHVMDNPF